MKRWAGRNLQGEFNDAMLVCLLAWVDLSFPPNVLLSYQQQSMLSRRSTKVECNAIGCDTHACHPAGERAGDFYVGSGPGIPE